MSTVPPCHCQHRRRRQIPISLLPLRFWDPARQAPQEHCSDPERQALSETRYIADGSGDFGEDERSG